MPGLLDTLVAKKVEARHHDEENRRAALRNFYYERISDPNTDPDVKEQITGDYLKLLSPEAKKHAQHGFDILARIKSAFGMGQQKQEDGPAPAPDATSGVVPPSTFPSAPAPTAAPPATEQLQAAAPVREETAGTTVPDSTFPENAPPVARLRQAAPARTQAASAPAAPKVDFFKNYGKTSEERLMRIKEAEAKFQRDTRVAVEQEKAKGRPVVLTSTNWETKDGQKVNGFSDKAGNFYDLEHNPVDMATVGKVIGKTSTARPTILASDFVTLNNARQLAENLGKKFEDEKGNEIDLSKAPAGMVLQRVHYPDGKETFSLRNINDKVVKVGGQMYAVNPAEVQGLPTGAGTALGVANAPSARAHEVSAVDAATGQPITNTLRSTTTPGAPGIVGRPTGGVPISAPSSVSPRATVASPAGSVPVPAPAPSIGGSRPLAGMTPGQVNQANQRVTPVREAVTQLFGDPGHPEVKTLKDFASLGDKPESMTRVGTALNMIFGGMEDAAGGAHISAGVGPVGVSTGGVGSLLQNYFGVKPELAQQNSEIMAKAMNALTPEEREYVNASVAAVSTMIGLRSLTRAPASEGTMKALERDIPLWGKNTFTKRDFADKMQHLGLLIANGAKGSEAILEKQSPGLLKHVQTSTGEMEKLKKEPVRAPSSPSEPIVQKNKTTGAYRYSTDGGKTWQTGQPK